MEAPRGTTSAGQQEARPARPTREAPRDGSPPGGGAARGAESAGGAARRAQPTRGVPRLATRPEGGELYEERLCCTGKADQYSSTLATRDRDRCEIGHRLSYHAAPRCRTPSVAAFAIHYACDIRASLGSGSVLASASAFTAAEELGLGA